MLVLPDDITIFDCERQAPVRAKLVRLNRELAAKEVDGTWWKIPVSKRAREAEGDHHWEWRKLIGLHRSELVWEALAVQSTRGGVEGASLYRVDAISQIESGEGAVFIDRLAVAPSNRPWLVNPPKYKGIGTALLLAAVRHSYSLGLGGRVWLTSLPTERTRDFYRKRGFRVIFEDENGMIDFELPTGVAQQWLEREGYL